MPELLPAKPEAALTKSEIQPTRSGNFRFSAAQFLFALILMLVVAPFVDDLKHGPAIDSALITVVLVTGVLAVGRSRRTLAVAAVLVLPAVVFKWVGLLQSGSLAPALHSITALAFIVFVEFELLHFIFRAPRVNSEVLCAGISGYLLLGILWMVAYALVSRLVPGSFAFNVGTASAGPLQYFDAYYFSFITLSTVGYGDITPASHVARTLAMTEAMTGTLYMAVLISRLVALYSSQGPKPQVRNE
jgi:hypothetical protein